MGLNSREKGKRGERLWRDFLREHGFTARRGQQFSGSAESPDVICQELSEIHFEVKFVENLNVLKAVEQAAHDAGSKTPVVAHKRSNSPWLITISAEDWIKLIKNQNNSKPHEAATPTE